jgi:hypothetical protein
MPPIRWEARSFRNRLEHPEELRAVNPSALLRSENEIAGVAANCKPCPQNPFLGQERLARMLRKRLDRPQAALQSPDRDFAIFKIHVCQTQTAHFAGPHPVTVGEQNHREVALRFAGDFQNLEDFLRRESFPGMRASDGMNCTFRSHHAPFLFSRLSARDGCGTRNREWARATTCNCACASTSRPMPKQPALRAQKVGREGGVSLLPTVSSFAVEADGTLVTKLWPSGEAKT